MLLPFCGIHSDIWLTFGVCIMTNHESHRLKQANQTECKKRFGCLCFGPIKAVPETNRGVNRQEFVPLIEIGYVPFPNLHYVMHPCPQFKIIGIPPPLNYNYQHTPS